MGNPGALKRPQPLSPSRLGRAARLLAEDGVCPMDTRSLHGVPGSFWGGAVETASPPGKARGRASAYGAGWAMRPAGRGGSCWGRAALFVPRS